MNQGDAPDPADEKKIEFIASLPPLMSAINMNGEDRSSRVKLDIPGSEISKVVRLLSYTGQTFKVTIEPDNA